MEEKIHSWLLTLFPEAKFIFIRRNPYEVFASNKRLWEVVLKKYSLGTYRNINTSEIILSTYSGMMDHYLHERNLIDPGNLSEISYEGLITNPVETIDSVYNHLNLNDFSYCHTAIKRYSKSQKQYRRLDHVLSQEELNLVTGNWKLYIKKFGYQIATQL